MEPILAKCGYRCDLCPAFETNLKGDDDKRRMSEALAKYYEYEIPPEKIRPCTGCRDAQEAPDKECRVYPCVQEKALANCGQCPDFGCDKLQTRMDVVEQCLSRHPNVPKEDFNLFFRPYLSRAVLTQIHESMQKS